jgi:hypothetical protein
MLKYILFLLLCIGCTAYKGEHVTCSNRHLFGWDIKIINSILHKDGKDQLTKFYEKFKKYPKSENEFRDFFPELNSSIHIEFNNKSLYAVQLIFSGNLQSSKESIEFNVTAPVSSSGIR